MSLSHRKGFATVEDAMHSKVFLLTPGADLVRDCPCGEVHVIKPAKPAKAPRPRKRLRAVKPGKPAAQQRPASPRGSVAAAVALVLAGDSTVTQAARLTGANPESVADAAWAAAKQRVHERDSETCLNCGQLGTDVHHRVRRGMGGTADPVIAFGMANLVLACRPCHSLAHRTDDPEMAVKGYRLEGWQSPAAEPLRLFDQSGSGFNVWLVNDGAYSTTPPNRGIAV